MYKDRKFREKGTHNIFFVITELCQIFYCLFEIENQLQLVALSIYMQYIYAKWIICCVK